MPPLQRRVTLLLAAATFLALRAGKAVAADIATVSIDNFTYAPQEIRVLAGTEITWTNRDDIPHTVTSVDDAFASPALDTDDRFTMRFDEPGIFRYYCQLHPHMTGSVIVT